MRRGKGVRGGASASPLGMTSARATAGSTASPRSPRSPRSPPPTVSPYLAPHDDHPAGYLQLSFATAQRGLGWDDDDDESENLLAPLIAFAQVYRHALREVDVGGVLGHEGERVPCFTVTWYDVSGGGVSWLVCGVGFG